MRFILDTNIISAIIKGHPAVFVHFEAHRSDEIYLCQPVYFETMRGLIWKRADSKIGLLERLRSQLGWLQLNDHHWTQAGRFWADSVSHGRQLSDVDLLIAALAFDLDAIIVSNDSDFDALSVQRENWLA